MCLDRASLEEALTRLTEQLLEKRTPRGHWEGKLSSSALSTATAVVVLHLAKHDRRVVANGLNWLARTQNPDGGWGDTTLSRSNISTTSLCWAAFCLAGGSHAQVIATAESWLARAAGSVDPLALTAAIARRYGKDRTFSVPILLVLALAGRLGVGKRAWRLVPQLPFELAACPHRWFKWLRLPVVSYALPALIAIGQARHYHCPTRNPLTRVLRSLARRRTLRVLESIQPESGGFLEAVPLTSFVVMSLVASGQAEHPVVARGLRFLIDLVRPDGSWPIDTNLATWVTTLSVNSLAVQPAGSAKIRRWLLAQQYRHEHPYTHAAPGGWAWTDLPGGVPDADDTAGALLALAKLGPLDDEIRRAAGAGVNWLLDLQNRDGGIPTFCRGWGALPFDRSGPDLTAHALRAWDAWRHELGRRMEDRIVNAMRRARDYLVHQQRDDGAWTPLWFGNELAPAEENPTYGTARVLLAVSAMRDAPAGMIRRGVEWLLTAQNPDGGWGGAKDVVSSIEETALAVASLAAYSRSAGRDDEAVNLAIRNGAAWLLDRTYHGQSLPAAPIGLYFAKLWYFEELYPLIFAIAGLSRVADVEGRKSPSFV